MVLPQKHKVLTGHHLAQQTKTMKKLAIFDLDGTLIDSVADLAQATNYALSQYGYPTHPTDAYRFFVGNGINKLFERALPEGEKSMDNVMKIRQAFIPYYNVHNRDFTRPYPGIVNMLETLQNAGVVLAIASNKYMEATTQLVKSYFPHIQFACVLGQREGVKPKPDPQIVYDIIEATKIEHNDIIYIGDSNVDMLTAKNAQLPSIGVTWGFRPSSELQESGATYIASTAEEIVEIILKNE